MAVLVLLLPMRPWLTALDCLLLAIGLLPLVEGGFMIRSFVSMTRETWLLSKAGVWAVACVANEGTAMESAASSDTAILLSMLNPFGSVSLPE